MKMAEDKWFELIRRRGEQDTSLVVAVVTRAQNLTVGVNVGHVFG